MLWVGESCKEPVHTITRASRAQIYKLEMATRTEVQPSSAEAICKENSPLGETSVFFVEFHCLNEAGHHLLN